MSKLKIPADSNFDAHRAMELANLVQRAYEQYNAYKTNPTNYWESLESNDKIIGSTSFDKDLDNSTNTGKVEYEILARFKFTEYKSIFLPEFFTYLSETVPFGFIAKREIEKGVVGIFIVFRGTLTQAEWFFNSQFKQVTFKCIENSEFGNVSKGFNKVYTRPGHHHDAKSLSEMVIETLKNCTSNSRIFVTGHSLGAALATLATADIINSNLLYKPILYTFASPRVGDKLFAKKFKNIECYRIANSEDLVVTVPPSTGQISGPEMYGKPIPNGDEDSIFNDDTYSIKTTVVTASKLRNKENIKRLARTFRRNLTNQVYEHIGEPLYFTDQESFLSSNHNMFETYRRALPKI